MATAPTSSTVLVVDDDADVRDLARLFLEVDGFLVVGEAADGELAVQRFEQLLPDIVLLDNQMPGLTGLEVAQRIFARRPDQLIVLFSAEVDGSVRERAHEMGVAACLTKADASELPALLSALTVPRSSH